ncbi:MAG: ACP phosphodiesterase [Cytophagales bacterium]|nr:ACP phosphodiesterase [Cytophagales bacterium]MDW8385286.1 ACP phosphodiesterase [Flammeovirgaceae bacterium]
MNFLAHFVLSCNQPLLLVGNFLGDFVKGKQYQNYPSEIAKGILLHRAIDNFTDKHPVWLQSASRLRPFFGRYSPILMDILGDYLLASLWENVMSAIPYSDFVASVYAILREWLVFFPPKAKFTADYMISEDWLMRYRSIEGTQRSLRGMAERLRVSLPFESATDILISYQVEYEQEFLMFWKEIQKFVVHFLKDY